MKIDILIYSLRGGGAERVAANLANRWSLDGHSVRIMLLSERTSGDYLTEPAVVVQSLGRARATSNVLEAAAHNFGKLWRLRGELTRRHPDIAIGIMGDAAIVLGIAATGLRLVTIGCEHNNPPHSLRGNVWKWLRWAIYRKLRAVTVLTEGAADWMRSNVAMQLLDVIPNAVVWPVAVNTPALSPNVVVAADRRVMLAVGRLTEAKGFDLLIESFAECAGSIPGWDLVILGEGPCEDALKRQVISRDLCGRVFLPGRAGNIADWYARAELFVMSSRFEGLPMVLLESMAAGVPAVCWDFEFGPRDIIRNGVDGVITENKNIAALGAALVAVATDNDARNLMGVRATEVRERFGEVAIMRRWNNLFSRLGVKEFG